MSVVVTGASGFIGRNLCVRLRELGCTDVVALTGDTSIEGLEAATANAHFVFHLAGVNRPALTGDFERGNVAFTQALCAALAATGRRVPVAFTSSTQAILDNPYGRSKLAAEQALLRYGSDTSSPVYLCRLTNVFGKWCRPNYNSVVATFCHNIARGLPITINDPAAPLRLLYIDDLVQACIGLLDDQLTETGFVDLGPVYVTSVGELADVLRGFARSRTTLAVDRVGTGLVRALYSTYLSHLPPDDFAYQVALHVDTRGIFVEMLKTPDAGQLSYFTAHPGATRGEHYHHSKSEKFLVVQGTARFGFRHIETGETHFLVTRGGEGRIVDTVPGWTHNITNIGGDELIVMLWANEIFDRDRPDTLAMKVSP